MDYYRERPDAATLIAAGLRGIIDEELVKDELRKRGLEEHNISALFEINKRRLDTTELFRLFWLGEIGDTELYKRLRKLGWDTQTIADLRKLYKVIPGIQDIIRMAVREAWNDEAAQQFGYDEDFPPEFGEWAQKQGLSADWARRYWRAHWELPSPSMGYEMLHRGIIDESTLKLLLKVQDYPRFWRDNLVKLSYRPYTRVDVRRMYGLGVLDESDVYRAYLDLGYDEEKARNMTEFTIRYENADGSSRLDEYRDLTRSVIVRAYRRGYIGWQEAADRLRELRYSDEDVGFLLGLADWERSMAAVPDLSGEYARDIKRVLERAYKLGIITRDTFVQQMRNVGYTERDAALMAAGVEYEYESGKREAITRNIRDDYLNGQIDRQRAMERLISLGLPSTAVRRIISDFDLAKENRTRQLPESALRRLVKYGIITIDQYAEELRNLGYIEKHVQWQKRWLEELASGE